METVTVKGGVTVDKLCPIKDTTHVYSSGEKIYSTTLNQCNLGGNNNKFYII